MGIQKITYYVIACDKCGRFLEDDAGELAENIAKKERAVKLAEEYGWICVGRNSWRCRKCKEESL
jgi:hypothetical protein